VRKGSCAARGRGSATSTPAALPEPPAMGWVTSSPWR